MCAVFPRALETYSHSTVRMLFEAVKGERRTRDVAAQALETVAVATVHGDSGVDVDATDFRECARTGPLYEAEWTDELGGVASRRRAEQLYVRSGRTVTRREDRLVA